ncbi:MAG: SUMF1/EgtB/PvdO family nonheme iron enzyme [Thermoguttaceae bacterium]|nr:SUMF1/EgtB/PvdO family nonheme iron enzyme [Thermoguttaceae bacterium]
MKRQAKKRRVATLAAALAIPAALLSTAETFVAAQETAAVAPSDAETSFAWDDVANLKAGDRKTLEIGGVEFAFRYCPPGAYPASKKNASTRRVEFAASEAFWIAETETTQRQWTAIMGTNPSAYAVTGVLAKRLNGQNFRGVDFAELPVENVDWFDCRRFASDLNALGVAPDGFEFRLPTFAEEECATRAGTTTAFYWGDEPDLSQANLQPPPEPNGARRAGTPKPVRSYPPNPWGFTIRSATRRNGVWIRSIRPLILPKKTRRKTVLPFADCRRTARPLLRRRRLGRALKFTIAGRSRITKASTRKRRTGFGSRWRKSAPRRRRNAFYGRTPARPSRRRKK